MARPRILLGVAGQDLDSTRQGVVGTLACNGFDRWGNTRFSACSEELRSMFSSICHGDNVFLSRLHLFPGAWKHQRQPSACCDGFPFFFRAELRLLLLFTDHFVSGCSLFVAEKKRGNEYNDDMNQNVPTGMVYNPLLWQGHRTNAST